MEFFDFPNHRRYEVSFDGVSGPILIEVPFRVNEPNKEQREGEIWGVVYNSALNVLLALDKRRFFPGYHPKKPGNCYKIERVR